MWTTASFTTKCMSKWILNVEGSKFKKKSRHRESLAMGPIVRGSFLSLRILKKKKNLKNVRFSKVTSEKL
jgi:hypothetical protein